MITSHGAGVEWYEDSSNAGTIPYDAAGIEFVDARDGGDGTCADGCSDVVFPLCRKGTCVAPTCEDARPHCHTDTEAGLRARMLCPVTCGCSEPKPPLLLSGQGFGCGPACQKTPGYTNALAALPCEDARPGSGEMSAFADQLFSLSKSDIFKGYTEAEMQAVGYIFGRNGASDEGTGCQAVSLLAAVASEHMGFNTQQAAMIFVCGGTYGGQEFGLLGFGGLQPLAVLCPVQCGCTQPELDFEGWSLRGCPSSCARQQMEAQPNVALTSANSTSIPTGTK